jgi:hypothetical protein
MAEEIERQVGQAEATSSPGPSGPAPEAPPAAPPEMNWPKAALWMIIAVVIAVNSLLIFKTCLNAPANLVDKTGKAIGHAGNALATVAAAFKQGTIKTSLTTFGTTVSNHQYLQFATVSQMERFQRSEQTSTAFGYVPLPDVVVTAEAPVVYTYYLDLNEKWELVLRDSTIYVFTPAVRANKPSVDASAINYEVKKGYFKTAEAQENLKRSIMSLATLRAKDNLPLARQTGRDEVAKFVENWMARSFADGKNYHVKVFFPGEKGPDGVAVERPKN